MPSLQYLDFVDIPDSDGEDAPAEVHRRLHISTSSQIPEAMKSIKTLQAPERAQSGPSDANIQGGLGNSAASPTDPCPNPPKRHKIEQKDAKLVVQPAKSKVPNLVDMPGEVLRNVLQHVLVFDKPIHVTRQRLKQGSYEYEFVFCTLKRSSNNCECEDKHTQLQSPLFVDTSLFMVSQSLRRVAGDVFFANNAFTFFDQYDLMKFFTTFKRPAQEIRSLKLMVYTSDSPARCQSSWEEIRRSLHNLRSLSLFVWAILDGQFVEPYVDGHLSWLYPLSKLLPAAFSCRVRVIKGNGPSWLAKHLQETLEERITIMFSSEATDFHMGPHPPYKAELRAKAAIGVRILILLQC